ncbi:MAG: PBP1A family penicillin-binding protein [Proteobacteria bacterium]|nr:PBP1A family penicillin-binding protein [Pseudomonadota bacterium]MBU1709170.1 PBP1A family penicillin-binding protein [Pseudomonadota bacterium]
MTRSKDNTPQNDKPLQWNHTHLIILLLSVGCLLSIFIGILLYIFISLDIPDSYSLINYRPARTSEIFDSKQQPVARAFIQNRYLVPLDDMPVLLPKAFVSAEDARFYSHPGIDFWSMVRALLHNINEGKKLQGGSTITQQVARSLLLTPEKTYTRKIKEAILAYRIDHSLSKDEILNIYLNQIYFGEGAYGVEAAARTYFGKSVKDLALAEISLLAGLPQAPSRYSPFKHFMLAKKRQSYVLNRMLEDGYITQTAADKAANQILFWGRRPAQESTDSRNNYFIQYVQNYVGDKYGRKELLTGGLTIHTSLDQNLQKAADQAIKTGIALWKDRQGVTYENNLPQAAIIVQEVKTGRVLAVSGGTDFSQSQFNRATQAKRQPGSAFKPFIYAAAFGMGYHPASIIIDEPIQFQGSNQYKLWEPNNFDNKFFGPTTLRNGLIHSHNIVAIKLLQELGVSQATELAKNMGISSPLTPDLTLALGSSEVALLELTSAYAVFANNGNYTKPSFIRKIIDGNGNILEDNHPESRKVLSSEIAYQITHLLEGVIKEGTGKIVKSIGIPVAGKTGTTDKNMDAWFIGYTPDLVVGVWMGFDKKKSLGRGETGARAAAPIWLDFMKRIKRDLPDKEFTKPMGITIMPMDSMTGAITNEYSESIVLEAFSKDNLPEKPAARHINHP